MRRRAGRRALLPGLVVLTLAVAALLGVLVLKHHTRFAVTRVVLQGVPEARRSEAEELTDGFLGQPLLFVDLDAAVAELARRPWVERLRRGASSRRRSSSPSTRGRRWPSRGAADGLWTVDRNGNALGPYAGRAVSARRRLRDPRGGRRAHPRRRPRSSAPCGPRTRRSSRVSPTSPSPTAASLVTDRVARVRLLFACDAGEPGRIAAAAASWRAALALLPQLVASFPRLERGRPAIRRPHRPEGAPGDRGAREDLRNDLSCRRTHRISSASTSDPRRSAR